MPQRAHSYLRLLAEHRHSNNADAGARQKPADGEAVPPVAVVMIANVIARTVVYTLGSPGLYAPILDWHFRG